MITLGLPMLYPQVAALKGAAKFQTLMVCSIEDFLPAPVARAFGPAAARVGGAGREIEFASLIDNDGAFKRHPHKSLEDEIAVLQYTGGTTGEPKGAMLTHANFCAVLTISNRWDHHNVNRGRERALAVLPLFHIFGLTFIMLLAIANGEQMVLHIKFDPDRVLADISRKKITVFLGVPTMYTALVNHPKVKEFDLSSVRRWVSGGAPLAMEVLQRFEALTGQSPKEGYGLTETAPLGTLQITDGPARQGSVGLPAPHTILEVVDLETGTMVLPVGQKGEICFRGPQVMKGYWKKPEATEEAFLGGRFHTGDIGFLDQDGFVTLVDRKKDMILSGGFNVFPRNIEEAIYEHPALLRSLSSASRMPIAGSRPRPSSHSSRDMRRLGSTSLRPSWPTSSRNTRCQPRWKFVQACLRPRWGNCSKKELLAEEIAKRQAGNVHPANAPEVA